MTLIALAIVAGLVFAFMPQPARVDVAQIQRGSLQVTVNEDGKTRIKDAYIVSAPLGGELKRIRLRAGDSIIAGETVLAEIVPSDPALLDARALAEAEARVRRAEAAMQQTRPALDQARARMDFAENELARTMRAFEQGAATDRELEAARLEEREAAEQYNQMQFAQDIARYELELAQAALLRTRPEQTPAEQAEHMMIRAPIDGRVLRVIQESQTVVTPGTELLEVGDPNDLEIIIDVLSTDAVRMRPGAEVFIEHWGGEHVLNARVRTIEPQAFTYISALGVEEQRVNIIADFTDPPDRRQPLGDAYRIEASIVIWEEDDVVLVPTNALFRSAGEWAVFVVEADRALLRSVRIGRQNSLRAQVLEGLEPGEWVVSHPGDEVRDGARVERR